MMTYRKIHISLQQLCYWREGNQYCFSGLQDNLNTTIKYCIPILRIWGISYHWIFFYTLHLFLTIRNQSQSPSSLFKKLWGTIWGSIQILTYIIPSCCMLIKSSYYELDILFQEFYSNEFGRKGDIWSRNFPV